MLLMFTVSCSIVHANVLLELPKNCWLFCSVLLFSHPRSEGWPHHGVTFSIYPCPLSRWLTLSRESCPRLDVVHPGRAWSSSHACTWHCSLHYLFLQVTPLFPHGATIVYASFLALTVSNSSLFTPALLRFCFLCSVNTRVIIVLAIDDCSCC